MGREESLSLTRVRTGVQLVSKTAKLAKHVVPVGHGKMGVPASKFDVPHAEHVVRTGGVLRYAAGTPEGKGGQIVAHLRDVGSRGQGLGLPSMGGKMLGTLTGIGAAASVANLAVSAVGFYMMNKKLNKLQSEIEGLRGDIEDMRGEMRAGFQRVEQRLVQIQYVLEGVREGQRRLRQGQEDIKDQLDAAEFAKVLTVVDFMSEYEQTGRRLTASRVDDFRDKLGDVRNRLKILINRWCRGEKAVETPGFARGTGYYQMWAMALALEARILREAGETRLASDLIQRELSSWYMEAAQDTVALLVDEAPGKLLSGAFQNRISSQQYLSILEFRRGAEFEAGEAELVLQEADIDQKETFGRSPDQRARSLRQYDPGPDYSRATQAHNLKELGRRLDTMALEYDVCARQNLNTDEWERRRLAEEESGEIHMISVEDS